MKHSKDPFIVNLFSEEFGWQLKGPSGGPAPGGRSGKPEGSSSGGLSSVTKVLSSPGAFNDDDDDDVSRSPRTSVPTS
jgi:hypothetical protein